MLKYVIKKNGQQESFDLNKIMDAITVSANHSGVDKALNQTYLPDIKEELNRWLKPYHTMAIQVIPTKEIHRLVLDLLQSNSDWKDIYQSYYNYHMFAKRMTNSFKKTYEESKTIIKSGDKENANKDSSLNSTKQALISTSTMREYMREFVLNPEWIKAHDEGWIHIHDLAERYLRGINCCLFNFGALLKDGFKMNGAKYLEPKTFSAAINVIGDVTLFASSQQYGGFTGNDLDQVLSKYAKLSYERYLNKNIKRGTPLKQAEEYAYADTIEEIEQGIQGFETKLNTVSNSLGQVAFVTVSFGASPEKWAREISKCILRVRMKGLGDGLTAIFPKLVLPVAHGLNQDPGDPNYDIKQLALECSSKRLYPDYLSLNQPIGAEENPLATVWKRSGKIISPMGCRALLSPWQDKDENDIITGRFNIGAVSLNLPKIAIESGKDWDKFNSLLDKYSAMAFEIHRDYYNTLSQVKGSTNPLMFVEGGSWKSVGMDDTIKPLLENATASLGYVGGHEAITYMGYTDNEDRQEKLLTLVKRLKTNVDKEKDNGGCIPALYSTPAESLIYRFNNLNREQYGVIEGVSDREYITNSFHVPVWEQMSVPEKIAFEAPFHQIATSGRISYNEWVHDVDIKVLEQGVDYAMDKGMYYGVNIVASHCNDCGHEGDFRDACPKCGSTNITIVDRCCGYLSYETIAGDTRYNPGKLCEVRDRVKHDTKGGL